MRILITIDGRIVVDIDMSVTAAKSEARSLASASEDALVDAREPTPLTDKAQTTLDDHVTQVDDDGWLPGIDEALDAWDKSKPDTVPGAIEASMSPSQQARWEEAQRLCGDIRIADIKPSGIKIIRCSICRRQGVNARSHPNHGGLGPKATWVGYIDE